MILRVSDTCMEVVMGKDIWWIRETFGLMVMLDSRVFHGHKDILIRHSSLTPFF